MMTIRMLLALGAVAAAGAALAQPPSQYRDGMPPVNAARPSDPDSGNRADLAAFARWYRDAKRPAMLVFWNRELIEDGTSQYDEVQTTAKVAAAAGRAGAIRGRNGAVAGAEVAAMSVTENRQYQERSTDSRYGFADGAFSRSVEASIMSTFLAAGANVVDREAVIRKLTLKGKRAEALDIQHLETVALSQGIQYLVEVLPNDDPGSPTGLNFAVKVIHIPTSTVRVQFATSGNPPQGEAQFVAVNGAGFVKQAAPERRSPALIGAQVAYETMSRLR